MNDEIIGLHQWFSTPAGQTLLNWERQACDLAVADVFGYHALQLGLPQFNALQANRMPHRWAAVSDLPAAPNVVPNVVPNVAFFAEFSALPFAENSLDLLVLPHALEFSPDPHATLREVARVLVPEGRVVICGFNPTSLWGWKQRRQRFYQQLGMGELYLPDGGQFIGYWRLRDWLRLLGFEVESGSFGCYRPAARSEKWLERTAWMDAVGARWWPILGAAYCVTAVKRVRGARLLEAQWRRAPRFSNAPVSIAPRAQSTPANPQFTLNNPNEHD